MQDSKIEDVLSSVLSGLKISRNQIIKALSELELNKKNIETNLEKLAKKLREITKPMIIVANKSDILQQNNSWKTKLEKLQQEFPQYKIIPVMAEYEWNLKKAAKAGLINYIPAESSFEILKKETLTQQQLEGLNKIQKSIENMKTTGVQDALDFAVFKLLKMKPIFPGGVSKLEDSNGNMLPDCFLMNENATALDFAYRLHTDFGKNFIKAINVKTKMMTGKDHVLEFGAIIEIVSGK